MVDVLYWLLGVTVLAAFAAIIFGVIPWLVNAFAEHLIAAFMLLGAAALIVELV